MKQHEEARLAANEVRLARAELKREVKSGDVALGEYLAEVVLPDWLHKMSLEELLDAVPWLRSEVIGAWLAEVPIRRGVYVGGLTYRKRRLLADRLTKWEVARRERAEARNQKRARRHAPSSGSVPRREVIA